MARQRNRQFENIGQLKGSTARADILVVEPNGSPAVIETEVLPAAAVESDASSRLGAQLKKTGRTILRRSGQHFSLSQIGIEVTVRQRDEAPC